MRRSILLLAFLIPVAACHDATFTRTVHEVTLANQRAVQTRHNVDVETAYMSPVAQATVPDTIDPLRLGARVAIDHVLLASWSSPAFTPIADELTAIVRSYARNAMVGAPYRIAELRVAADERVY